MIRPITLWPFPNEAVRNAAKKTKVFLIFEMSTGQMVDDVRLALEGRAECEFYGRPGGVVPAAAGNGADHRALLAAEGAVR